MWRKITRFETLPVSVTFGFFLSVAMSAVGTPSIISTSPARRAAMREAPEVIGRIVTLSQSGFSPQ